MKRIVDWVIIILTAPIMIFVILFSAFFSVSGVGDRVVAAWERQWWKKNNYNERI